MKEFNQGKYIIECTVVVVVVPGDVEMHADMHCAMTFAISPLLHSLLFLFFNQ